MSKSVLRHRDQLAIWRTAVDLPQVSGGDATDDELRRRDSMGRQQAMSGWLDTLPDHDWTQHNLGDAEDWSDQARQFEATTDPNVQFPGMGNLQDTGVELGTHNSQVHEEPATGNKWLIKQPPTKAPYLAHGDVAASAIQQHSGLDTPPTFLTQTAGGKPASAQLMYPNAKDAFPGKKFDPEKLNDEDLLTIQKHHALDWLIGNHDSHGGQFIRDQSGKLIGIDKGQAFKYFNQDQLHWNHHPNAHYDEKEPVYNTLYRNFAKGGRQIFDPRDGDLGKYVQGLQDIPDDEYRGLLQYYAQTAKAQGALGRHYDPAEYQGLADEDRFDPNDANGFLDAAVHRKNNLTQDLGRLYDKAQAYRETGTKMARRFIAARPNPREWSDVTREYAGADMGSHNNRIYRDPQGDWMVKHPNQGNEFLAPLDVATSHLQRGVGLDVPETHAVPMDGNLLTAVKMYPGAHQEWREPPHLGELSPQDQLTIQKHQAIDWLIANHDAHVGNWLRAQNGNLIGIDKSQALKYFGQDRLDHKFHPNFYAREPIYNQLWREHGGGAPGQMLDPREGELGEFVNRLQSVPDNDFRAMFAPYAHGAAQAGMLATGKYGGRGPADPRRNLSPPSVPPNDPPAFLDALVARKNNLSNDLGTLYDKATIKREKSLGAQGPQAPMAQKMGVQQVPPNIEFRHEPKEGGGGKVKAFDTNERWMDDHRQVGYLGWNPEGRIGWVSVDPDYHRKGVASGMLEHARSVDPNVHHSDALLDEGQAWSKAVP